MKYSLALILSFAAAWTGPLAVFAQSAQQRGGSVSGQVVNAATGEPVRKAQVQLLRTDRGGASFTPLSAQSDASGNFRIDDVPAGTYRVAATRTGFVGGGRGQSMARSGGNFKPVAVSGGEDVKGVVMKLTPAGVIAGRVLDEDGDAVEAAQVQLLRNQYINGKRQLQQVRSGISNDLGEFRVSGIDPGKYLLAVTKRGGAFAIMDRPPIGAMMGRIGPGGGFIGGPGARGGGQALNIERPEYEYVTVYYPAAVDSQAATPIQVNGGAEMRGIDFRLQKARVFHVRGKVSGLAASLDGRRGGPGAVVTMRPATGEGMREARPAGVAADGRFEVRGVRPGSYILTAHQGGRDMQMSGRANVQVGESDVSGVEVFLQAHAQISGRIAAEGGQALPAARFNVQFTPIEEGAVSGGGGRFDEKSGTFRSSPLEPSRYRVSVQPMPEGYYLKSVRWADQEVIESGLMVTAGAAGELVLTLAQGAGTIAGSVRDGNDQPLGGAIVTLIPSGRYANWWDLYRYATVSDTGEFRFSGLRPGTYKVHAWEQLENGAHQDALFMRPFDAAGLSVTVQPSGTETVQLGVIPASATQGR